MWASLVRIVSAPKSNRGRHKSQLPTTPESWLRGLGLRDRDLMVQVYPLTIARREDDATPVVMRLERLRLTQELMRDAREIGLVHVVRGCARSAAHRYRDQG